MTQSISIVTGGASGIGAAIANAFAIRGDQVIVFDRIETQNAHKHIQTINVDVASAESVRAGFSAIAEQFPKVPIRVLVNNAGITRDGLVLRMSEQDWRTVLDVNLTGAFLCAQEVLKGMVRARAGYIINISSIVGLRGNAGQANYAASKAGLIGLTKSLAAEYGSRGINVNGIAPGFIQTAMTDRLSDDLKKQALGHIALARFGKVEEIAALASFLTSGDADYITGQIIGIDGGMG